MFDSNLDILNVLGPITMKIGMYCWETLFQHIPAYFKFETLFIKKIHQRSNGPVNAHLISGPSKSTKQRKPGRKYEKDLINKS